MSPNYALVLRKETGWDMEVAHVYMTHGVENIFNLTKMIPEIIFLIYQ